MSSDIGCRLIASGGSSIFSKSLRLIRLLISRANIHARRIDASMNHRMARKKQQESDNSKTDLNDVTLKLVRMNQDDTQRSLSLPACRNRVPTYYPCTRCTVTSFFLPNFVQHPLSRRMHVLSSAKVGPKGKALADAVKKKEWKRRVSSSPCTFIRGIISYISGVWW